MATRHERVIVDLDDRFSRGMAGMAANVSLFRKHVEGADRDVVKFDKTTQDVGRNIDKLSGRLGLLVDVAATLGPALIPTAAAAVPLLAGLSNQLGFVAIAGGSTVLAFQGVGTALKAVNEQQINPSTANLEKMHEAMAALGPAGRDFVRELQSLRPEMQKLQDAAQAGLFPGMTEGITALTTRLPQAQGIISTVSNTLGDLLKNAGESLAGPQWDDFFHMLETEARPSLMALGESIGQVTKGLADLWVAFTPLNRDFSKGMLDASRSFAEWADGLSQTQGFADFMAYLQQTGPQVAEALGSIGNALLQVLEAAAPLGGPALAAITAFSKAVAAVADSSLGTPIFAGIAAWRAYSMAVGLAEKAQMRFNAMQAGGLGGLAGKSSGGGLFAGYTSSLLGVTSAQERAQTAAGKTSQTVMAQRAAFAKGAAGAALLGVAMTGAADKVGAANTAMLGLTGFMVAGGPGAAVGALAGVMLDAKAAGDDFDDTIKRINADVARADFSHITTEINSLDAAIADKEHINGFKDFMSDLPGLLVHGIPVVGNKIVPGTNQQRKQRDDAASSAEVSKDATLRERGAALANGQLAASSQLAAHGFQMTAAGARDAAGGLAAFTAAAKRANAAISRQGTFDAYRSSLLDFNDSLKTNGKTLDRNTRAGLANRDSLRNIATTALSAGEQIKGIGAKSEFLQKARKNFISAATAAGATRAQARQLATTFGLVDRIHAKPKVDEQGSEASRGRVAKMRAEIERLKNKAIRIDENGAAAARARIAALQAQINMLHGRTVTNTINTITHRSGFTPQGSADGSTVPKTGLPYADRHLYLLADGEEVVSNRYGQADRNRDLLKRINANMLADGGTVQGLADGGSAGRRRGNNGNSPANTALHHHLQELTWALERSTKAIDKEKQAREDLIGKRNDLASTVGGAFTTDLFGQQPANLSWMNAGQKQAALTQSVFSTLKSDIANANTFQKTLTGLKKRGLDGQALASLAASGDVQRAQAFAGMSNKDLGSYETLFNQRAHAAASVGSYAGNAVYGAQIAAQTKALHTLVAQNKALAAQLKAAQRHKATIHVHEAHNAKHTAKEVSRRQAMG